MKTQTDRILQDLAHASATVRRLSQTNQEILHQKFKFESGLAIVKSERDALIRLLQEVINDWEDGLSTNETPVYDQAKAVLLRAKDAK